MSTPYTSAELWAKVRTIDAEIEALRIRPLNYRIGSKWVNRDEQFRWLIQNRKALLEHLQSMGLNVAEKHIVVDYEMDEFGKQHGETIDGED